MNRSFGPFRRGHGVLGGFSALLKRRCACADAWDVNTTAVLLVSYAASMAIALVVGPWLARLDRAPAVVRVQERTPRSPQAR